LQKRGTGKTICPSEAARLLEPDENWRALMEPVRQVAAALANEQLVEITQRGQVVVLAQVTGPVRIRLVAADNRDIS
ncbi:MAG: DUF3253 domain-containing protein, partial [Pseudomonadota bacterium]